MRTKKDRDRYKFKQDEVIANVIEGKANDRRESKVNIPLSYGTVQEYYDSELKEFVPRRHATNAVINKFYTDNKKINEHKFLQVHKRSPNHKTKSILTGFVPVD